ncbi:MAG: ABC transporter ATP-binding protein [Planctomycetota bacterium]
MSSEPTTQANAAPGHDAEVAIRVTDLGKCYHVYKRPIDRLKQAAWRWKRQFYREYWALQGVSFELRRGESVGILGRNGSGKSTLLQLICGTLAPTVGTIEVAGRISALLELGAGFNKEFTGRENVYLAGRVMGLTRSFIEDRFDAIESFADIGDFIDQPVKTLSSGMYVRLAYAVVAQVEPDILVIDEALAVGDIFFRQKCARHMRETLAGVTRLIVSHDMQAMTTLCDRVVVLKEGELVFDGEPAEAVELYTKMMHKQAFAIGKAARSKAAPNPRQPAPAGRAIDESLPWIEITEDGRSGRGEIVIDRLAVTDAKGERLTTAKPGTRLRIHAVIDSHVAGREVLFGYTIRNRVGQAVFGETTLRGPGKPIRIDAEGRYTLSFELVWPEVTPGNYTLTVGIGEGSQALQHVIQCWALNAVAIGAISPTVDVHGMFNCPMEAVEFTAVDQANLAGS